MLDFYDHIQIFLCCSVSFYLIYNDYTQVLVFLAAVALCALNLYFDNQWARFLIFFGYILLCCFFGNLLLFFPCLIYDSIRYPYRYLAFLMVIPMVRFSSDYTLTTLILTGLFLVLSIYLSLHTQQMQMMKHEFNQMRDSAQELYLVQEEKNRHVLENQDYEINLAMLNERNRISKEIHDNIGHLLSRSLLQIGALLTIVKDETTKECMTDLRDSISSGLDSIRASIHNMHDESVDLYSSLYTLIQEFTFCKIQFDYDLETTPPLKLKYCFISTVKESLSNIVKHSNATKVCVVLREHPGLYQLIISDNGTLSTSIRYRLNQQLNETGYNDGMGLQNIIDRVKGFDGTIHFNFEEGFQIYIIIPKVSTNTSVPPIIS